MPWVILFIASVFEIAWAISMRYTQGFTQLWPTLGVLAMMAISFLLVGRAIMHIPLGTAYAIWSGIGAAGAAIFGIVLYAEPVTMWRVLSLLAIVVGVLGLKFIHKSDAKPRDDLRGRI